MKRLLLSSALCLLSTSAVFAQQSSLDDVAFEQKIGGPVDGAATFTDDHGQTVRFGDLTHGRPTMLMVGFYECPMLCDPLLQNMASSLKKVDLVPGKDFNIVTLSINPAEKSELAAEKKESLVKAYGHPESADGWHILTGEKDMIDRLTASVGYHYAALPGGQFSHPAGLIMLTPDGKVDRYLVGMTFQPRDMRLSMVEASQGKLGTFNDNVLLRCYHYDPSTGRYGFAIQAALRITGCTTAALLFICIGWLSYRHRQHPEVRA